MKTTISTPHDARTPPARAASCSAENRSTRPADPRRFTLHLTTRPSREHQGMSAAPARQARSQRNHPTPAGRGAEYYYTLRPLAAVPSQARPRPGAYAPPVAPGYLEPSPPLSHMSSFTHVDTTSPRYVNSHPANDHAGHRAECPPALSDCARQAPTGSQELKRPCRRACRTPLDCPRLSRPGGTERGGAC